MKKTFFAIMLMLASVVTLKAQSLTETAWLTNIPDEENAEMVLNFDDDGSCYIIFTKVEVDEENGMSIRVSMTVPGVYTRDDNMLDVNFNKEEASINIDYTMEGLDAHTKAMMDAMILPELKKMEPEIKKNLLEAVPSGAMEIMMLTDVELLLKIGDEKPIFFGRTAKG
ncbi:MAG: hypothetical protein IKX63_05010 [Muribaculaceae bacterium]|nr:hypothetical protein [Muribaculaceae bacterium]